MPAFKKGDVVRVNSVVPEGPVEKFMMDEDGVVHCYLRWVDKDGSEQERWFREDELVKV